MTKIITLQILELRLMHEELKLKFLAFVLIFLYVIMRD